jgi:2-keto-4-pentenoate hydratase/2-oxohepta-3-ene-1,7-dioic acid hydratase in catechol pathway
MKFLTLEQGHLGALVGDQVVNLVEARRQLGSAQIADTLEELINLGDEAAQQAWRLAQRAVAENCALTPYAEVTPLAPIPQPRRNIFCLGKNYLDHALEVADKMKLKDTLPEKPMIFTKATTAVIGPGEPIPAYPELTSKLDYEAELAIIIGKKGRDIAAADAMDYIFGYTAINDISARDLQRSHGQFFRGKSLDGFAPMGPVVVHLSQMPKPGDISVKCFVNGEQRQNARLDMLIFDIPTIIETLSSGMTLLPGDIIATGTPAGVGMGFRPSRYLNPGDEVVVEVTGVGRLINPVSTD